MMTQSWPTGPPVLNTTQAQQYYCSNVVRWECTETRRSLAWRRMFKVRWPLLWLHWLLWHEPGPACERTGSSAGTLGCRCYHSRSCSLQRGKALPGGTRPLVAWLHYFSPNNIVLKSHLPDWRVTDTEKANTWTPADSHQPDTSDRPFQKTKACSDPRLKAKGSRLTGHLNAWKINIKQRSRGKFSAAPRSQLWLLTSFEQTLGTGSKGFLWASMLSAFFL